MIARIEKSARFADREHARVYAESFVALSREAQEELPWARVSLSPFRLVAGEIETLTPEARDPIVNFSH